MKTAKKLLALLLALVMVLAIAACTPAETPDTKPNTGNDTPKDTTPKDTEEEHEPVTITILTHQNEGCANGLELFNAMFMEKYPWITVEVEMVAGDQIGAVETARFAAKDCDIIRGGSYDSDNSLFTWIPEGILTESTSVTRYKEGLYLDLSDIPELENWGEAAKLRGMYDGKWLSVPTGGIIANGVFYNKTMFDKYNLEVPLTWDELINVCETLYNAGENVMISGHLDNWPPFILSRAVADAVIQQNYEGANGTEKLLNWNKSLWEGTAAYNDEVHMEAWEKIDQINKYWCDASYNCNLDAATAEFLTGDYAIYVDGSWAISSMAAADFEWGYFGIPGEKAPADGAVALAGRGDIQWSVCAGTKYPEECKLWIAMYSTPEGYATYLKGDNGNIPYAMEGLVIENPDLEVLAPGLVNQYVHMENLMKSAPGTGQWASFNAGISGLASCLGTMTVQELADAANADWELAMEQAGMR